jgi:hypothetical protein
MRHAGAGSGCKTFTVGPNHVILDEYLAYQISWQFIEICPSNWFPSIAELAEQFSNRLTTPLPSIMHVCEMGRNMKFGEARCATHPKNQPGQQVRADVRGSVKGRGNANSGLRLC